MPHYLNIFADCLTARSRTRTDAESYPGMFTPYPLIRAMVCASIFPPLIYPIGILRGIASIRCLASGSFHRSATGAQFEEGQVQYLVQKRTFDQRTKQIQEAVVKTSAEELSRALSVCKNVRGEFVDDPKQKFVSYLIIERPEFSHGYLDSTGEAFLLSVVLDFVTFALPLITVRVFWKPSIFLLRDLRDIFRGTLRWNQCRHPIRNFFVDLSDQRRAQARLNIARAPPKHARPWHYKF